MRNAILLLLFLLSSLGSAALAKIVILDVRTPEDVRKSCSRRIHELETDSISR